MSVVVRLADEEFMAGVVVARGVRVMGTPDELAKRVDDLVARRSGEEFPSAVVKEGVRGMLRKGGYRPSGRGKPASEYLAQAARDGRFPRINNLVDVNNYISLAHGVPVSMLDLEAVGEEVEIRYGREGERYVFNASGQEMDVAGCVCVCRVEGGASVAVGNPVKDSMAGKIKEGTVAVIGVVYGSKAIMDEAGMRGIVDEFSQLLRTYGDAREVDVRVVRGG